MVYELGHTIDSGSSYATAHRLEEMYASQKHADTWRPGETDDIAWETNRVARAEVYEALGIPVEPCQPEENSCANALKGPYRAGRCLDCQRPHSGGLTATHKSGSWPD